MSTAVSADLPEYGPWHPGISSELPARLLPLATIFRAENVFTSLEWIRELHDLTGLPHEEFVVFRLQRLVVHEVPGARDGRPVGVEAYTGMPALFFTWALRSGMAVHYELLDNDVPYGERPRTVAFGWNGEMSILDVKGLLDIDRHRKIDIDAKRFAVVYPDGGIMAPDRNTQFLRDCARRLAAVSFADRETGHVYARLDAGCLSWTDPEALEAATKDPATRAGLLAVAPEAFNDASRSGSKPRNGSRLASTQFHTLGRWGTSR